MKRFDLRIVFGFLLIVGGVLALAQTMGLLTDVSDIVWGGLFLAAGLIFLSLLFGGHWWAAFPGFHIVALGALILLPDSLEALAARSSLAALVFHFGMFISPAALNAGGR